MSALFKKLNLGSIQRTLVLNAPESFQAELDQLEDVKVLTRSTTKTRVEFALGFACTESERDRISAKLVQAADGDAVVWLAYPKKSSKNYTCSFNRDSGWQVFGDAGFEGVRQVAIDEDWSALRFRRTDNIKSITRDASRAISKSGQARARK
jgi:hypothetical protein